MKVRLVSGSPLPEWFVYHVVEFIASKASDFPTEATLRFISPKNGAKRWKGLATPYRQIIRIWWPKHFVFLPDSDNRFRDGHLAIKWDIRNRAESFVFLLAHEFCHLRKPNMKLYLEANGFYISEFHANAFGQMIVNDWRREVGWKKLRIVRKIQLFKIAARQLKAASRGGEK